MKKRQSFYYNIVTKFRTDSRLFAKKPRFDPKFSFFRFSADFRGPSGAGENRRASRYNFASALDPPADFASKNGGNTICGASGGVGHNGLCYRGERAEDVGIRAFSLSMKL